MNENLEETSAGWAERAEKGISQHNDKLQKNNFDFSKMLVWIELRESLNRIL